MLATVVGESRVTGEVIGISFLGTVTSTNDAVALQKRFDVRLSG
jgi:hypothetical protein